MSSYVSTRIRDLSQSLDSLPLPTTHTQSTQDASSTPIQKSLAVLSLESVHPPSPAQLTGALATLQGREDDELEWVLLARATLGAYDAVAHRLLEDARRLEDAIWYWRQVEENRGQSAVYLVQTLPLRIRNLFQTLSTHRPTSLLHLPPALLTSALFPHTSSRSTSSNTSRRARTFSTGTLAPSPSSLSLRTLTFSPLSLTRHEARLKKQAVERARDALASDLGTLAGFDGLRRGIAEAGFDGLGEEVKRWVLVLSSVLDGSSSSPELSTLSSSAPTLRTLSTSLHALLRTSLPQKHHQTLSLLREHAPPSALQRLWPYLVLGPPAAYALLRLAYNSRETIVAKVKDAKETVGGFVQGWVVQPIEGILGTVRHGGHGLGVGQDSLRSDLESLERMVSEFAKEKYHLSEPEVAALAARVRDGDLSPVLKVYEEELKSPLKSAITGQLVRSLLIQIQKVKVDVDASMAKLDALLKSQELTFGFVGVAPSLGVLYVVGSWAKGFVAGLRGERVGREQRGRVFDTMRRIDLILPPSSPSPLPPAHLGHLLLSTSSLRSFAERDLPRRSRLRKGFLEDVVLLEDPQMDVRDKRAVQERMWRCWGGVLGWARAAQV